MVGRSPGVGEDLVGGCTGVAVAGEERRWGSHLVAIAAREKGERFREQRSLWARYMLAKYGSNSSPLIQGPSGRASPIWRRLLRARPFAQPNIRWLVGEGNVHFWDDIWIDNTTLREHCLDDRGNPRTLVTEFIRNSVWDEPKLQLVHDQAGLPQPIIEKICDTPVIPGESDIPRWTLSRLGDLSVASTWDTIRTQRPIVPALDDIWKAGLTTSIAVFAWRLLSNRIPVDTKLQWRKELNSKPKLKKALPSL